MKKSIVVLTLAIAVFVLGCASNTPTEPVSNLVISASLTRQDMNEMPGQTVYMVMLLKGFMFLEGASVSVSGPHGVTTLADNGFGMYSAAFQDESSAAQHYVFGQSYTVSVNAEGRNYSATATAPGAVTITADATVLSWSYEGNKDVIQAVAPNNVSVTAGPDVVSPYNLGATGIFSNGSGLYGINANIVKETTGFSGASVLSAMVMAYQKTYSYDKP